MTLIVAIIRPEKLEAVQAALEEPDACLVSISEVGDGLGMRSFYRGAEIRVSQPRLRLEVIVVNEMLVRDAVQAIVRAGAATGEERLGHGNVFAIPLNEYVRIPTAPRTMNSSNREQFDRQQW
jgi:nitrogen regulatory protein P-II 2